MDVKYEKGCTERQEGGKRGKTMQKRGKRDAKERRNKGTEMHRERQRDMDSAMEE